MTQDNRLSPNGTRHLINRKKPLSFRFDNKMFTGFEGDISYNTSKPDGTKLKRLNTSLIKKLGWEPSISLRAGLRDSGAREHAERTRDASGQVRRTITLRESGLHSFESASNNRANRSFLSTESICVACEGAEGIDELGAQPTSPAPPLQSPSSSRFVRRVLIASRALRALCRAPFGMPRMYSRQG